MEGEFFPRVGLQPNTGVDKLPEDQPGGLRSDLLDVHPTGRGRHDDGAPAGAVDEDSQVELFLDRERLFHQHPPHDASRAPGLARHQSHADHGTGDLLGLLGGGRQLDSATLAPPTGVNLRLDRYLAP